MFASLIAAWLVHVLHAPEVYKLEVTSDIQLRVAPTATHIVHQALQCVSVNIFEALNFFNEPSYNLQY